MERTLNKQGATNVIKLLQELIKDMANQNEIDLSLSRCRVEVGGTVHDVHVGDLVNVKISVE